jgi:hypothetical protein
MLDQTRGDESPPLPLPAFVDLELGETRGHVPGQYDAAFPVGADRRGRRQVERLEVHEQPADAVDQGRVRGTDLLGEELVRVLLPPQEPSLQRAPVPRRGRILNGEGKSDVTRLGWNLLCADERGVVGRRRDCFFQDNDLYPQCCLASLDERSAKARTIASWPASRPGSIPPASSSGPRAVNLTTSDSCMPEVSTKACSNETWSRASDAGSRNVQRAPSVSGAPREPISPRNSGGKMRPQSAGVSHSSPFGMVLI